jgi:hypothetical protein
MKMDLIDQLKEVLAAAEADAAKFYGKGNNAAGTRLRVGMQRLKALAQEVRVDVQSKKSG